MLPEATVVAYAVLAAVLAVGGLGALRSPGAAAQGVRALDVPAWLDRPTLARAHPWLELAAAAGLVGAPHPASVLVAVVTAGLVLGYLVLVARAVARGSEEPCHCFGAWGVERLGPRTVVRNAVLLGLALLVLLDTARGGAGPARLAALTPDDWGWLVAAAVAALVAVLVAGSRAGTPAGADNGLDPGIGLPVPDVPVLVGREQRGVGLRELAAGRPQLLLFLSPTCGPCLHLTGRLGQVASRLPGLDVRVVSPLPAAQVAAAVPDWVPYLLHEPAGAVSSALGVDSRPAAVLLGGEGLLAGGPVRGVSAVEGLIARAGSVTTTHTR